MPTCVLCSSCYNSIHAPKLKGPGFSSGFANKYWSPHFHDSPFPRLQRERVEFIRSFKPQQTPGLLLFSFCLLEIKELNSVFPKVWSLDQKQQHPEMIRKANYQVSLQTHSNRNSGVKAQKSVLKSLSSESNACSSLTTTGLIKSPQNKSCLVRT